MVAVVNLIQVIKNLLHRKWNKKIRNPSKISNHHHHRNKNRINGIEINSIKDIKINGINGISGGIVPQM